MDLGIRGETALVLAGTKGLGFGCAKALAEAGVRVAVNGRNSKSGAEAVAKLGPAAHYIEGDISKQGDRERIVAEARKALGAISILVTNAGHPPFGRTLDLEPDTWRQAFELSHLSAIETIRHAIPDMLKNGFGRILNVGSISMKRPEGGRPLSNSIKAGLVGALVTLSKEVADKGITVNNLVAGPFDTELLRDLAGAISGVTLSKQEAFGHYVQTMPMKRVGTIEEFGALCAFLASRQASYITGQSIVIDGGLISSLL